MEEKEKVTKKKPKKIIWIIIAAVLLMSLITFIADMTSQKRATENDVEGVKEPENQVDYIKNVDVNDDSGQSDPTLVAATYKGAVDGNTIRVLLDDDEVVVHLAGILPADKIEGMPTSYWNSARSWIDGRFTEKMPLYLNMTDYTDGEYSALVYDKADIDFTNEIAFWKHCINAEEIMEGYGNVTNENIGAYSTWMREALSYAQAASKGIWDRGDNFTLCGYSVPDRFIVKETQVQEVEPETETEQLEAKSKGKKKNKKKVVEKVDATES